MRSLLILCMWLFSASASAELSFQRLAELTDSPAELTGDFQQDKTIKQFDTSIRSTGHFNYERHEFIRWVTETPVENSLIMTPSDLRSQQADQDLLHLQTEDNPAAKIISRILFAVLTADWPALAEYFTVDGKQQGEQWTVTLTPKDKALKHSITGIDLSGAHLLETVTLHEKNGDTTHITFSDLTPG